MAAAKVVRTVVDPTGTAHTLRPTDTITHVALQLTMPGVWVHVSSHRTARAARTYWGGHCEPAGDVVICPVQTAVAEQWVTVDRTNIVHTTPVDDDAEHDDSWCCPCVPTVQVFTPNGGVSVVHHAWDGRP